MLILFGDKIRSQTKPFLYLFQLVGAKDPVHDEQLVSTTDLQGVITYANDHFCRVAGYSRAELIGQHHNMVRHPDMPKAAFAAMLFT